MGNTMGTPSSQTRRPLLTPPAYSLVLITPLPPSRPSSGFSS